MNLAIDIIATAQAMNSRGINQGTSGNVSARTNTGMLITPSGVDYSHLTPDDIVAMDFDASWFATSSLRPSSEWRFHLDILRSRSDVNAVVHTHSTHATALAMHGQGIGGHHYMVAAAGGTDIRCAPYATFGTQELSDNALAALRGRRACLLAHHGVITTGPDLPSALQLAIQVEELARQYLVALALGEPPSLPAEELEAVVGKMGQKGYGSSPRALAGDATILHLDR
ncbi:MAG: class II aldolase [Actinomycetia bacterium]|nr:class II aldolase [Actinomycetes bacterium]MCP5030504.1 class II aldolase [Actinomycetes bacterium]